MTGNKSIANERNKILFLTGLASDVRAIGYLESIIKQVKNKIALEHNISVEHQNILIEYSECDVVKEVDLNRFINETLKQYQP